MANFTAKMDTSSFTFHKQSVEETCKSLTVDLKKGLTSAEAEKRLKEYGPNELDKEEDKTLWERIMEQFEDILVQILLVAATISFIIAITGKSNLRILAVKANLTRMLFGQERNFQLKFKFYVAI